MKLTAEFTKKARFAAIACITLVLSMAASSLGKAETVVKSLDVRTSMAGPWKIHLGDDMTWSAAAYNDSAWDTVDLPGSIMPYVMKNAAGIGKTRGVLWLRKTIKVDASLPAADLGVMLGRIGNADETYFNGNHIGGMGKFSPAEHSMWNHPRHYRVSSPLVRHGGDNVIAVRISYFIFGEMLGDPAITNVNDLESSGIISRFLLVDMSYIAIAMGATLLFFTLFFFLRRPASREYLYYLLQLLCGIFMIMELCTYWNVYGTLLNRFKILGLAWAAVNVFHPIFLHRIYDLKRRRTEIVLWVYLALVAVITIFFVGEADLRAGGIFMIILTYAIGPYSISCHVTALMRKHPYAKWFSFFGITIVVCSIHDGIIFLMKFAGYDLRNVLPWLQYMIFQYAAMGLYIGTALVLVARFIRVIDEVEDLNTSLENFVIENALLNDRLRESNGSPRKVAYPVISDGADEKIQQVINFIQDNYTFDISREGLAATVDVHPDSLGKLFKSRTSKKLGDYINELRVKDAARRLVETDESIINIAFAVGFDSLRTFNRAFPKFMNMTPEKYRKQSGK